MRAITLIFAFCAMPLLALAGDFDHSHEAFTTVLKTRVTDGRVDYTRIKAGKELDGYLEQLEDVYNFDGWSTEQKLAYWVNAYNAYTLKLITSSMPVASIKDINWPLQPWDVEFIVLQGKKYTLNNLEHDIIRKEFSEPRIHFALVCASGGCPPLRNEAFRAADLDAQLEDQARVFLRDPAKNKVEGGVLHLSKIFSWYGSDFDGVGGYRTFVNERLPGAAEATSESYLSYDWTLNGY